MDDAQEKILATLRKFASLDRETLMRQCLAGYFTFAAERQFDVALLKLRDAGQVQNSGGIHGRWWIPTPTTAAAVECAAPAARSEPKKPAKSARK
jgi:hypothetical protein